MLTETGSPLRASSPIETSRVGCAHQSELVGTAHPTKPRLKRAWAPDANDHLVYQWVRFDGKKQSWVASKLGISQPTVSRIVERYERWQAHASDREEGRLDRAERLRAQRWLTYERNELVLASALRIAGEMEGFQDVSKSVVSRPFGQPSAEHELRTEHSVLDRTGQVAKYLRLAFRVNMEQLKLCEADEPARPEPLSAEQVAAEEQAAASATAEFESHGWRVQQELAYEEEQERLAWEAESRVGCAHQVRRESPNVRRGSPTPPEEEVEVRGQETHAQPEETHAQPAEQESDCEAGDLRFIRMRGRETRAQREEITAGKMPAPLMHGVNKMNTENPAEIDASPQPAGSCAAERPNEEISDEPCIPAEPTPPTRRRVDSPTSLRNPTSSLNAKPQAAADRVGATRTRSPTAPR